MCSLWKILSSGFIIIHYPHYVRNFSINQYHQNLRFFPPTDSAWAFSILVAVFLAGRVNIAVPHFSIYDALNGLMMQEKGIFDVKWCRLVQQQQHVCCLLDPLYLLRKKVSLWKALVLLFFETPHHHIHIPPSVSRWKKDLLWELFLL